MKNIVLTLPTLILMLFSSLATVHASEEAPAIKVQALAGGGLHLLQGRGGNVLASIGLDGVLLVDNDYADLGPAYEKAIAELSQSELAPGFIINTHWHSDHAGNNEYWGYRGSIMVAHNNVRQRMSTTQEMPALGMTVEPSADIALPLVTFADSIALHFNGNDIEVQHYPNGHTDGDSVVFYSNDNVVHMGDLFFKDRFPFVDLGSSGSVSGYIANVSAVLARVDAQTIIVPGHGSIANRADLERYLDMLKTTTAQVYASLDSGQSVDAIVAAGLGPQWESWGQGFISEERWIQTVAAER
ncbi:MAG: MBL fold metallo-hydrolase [Gammaproteobacteria bacterium]|nr:MBL fold metallo-hydrolase [Gammaproteobacteria bacterium]